MNEEQKQMQALMNAIVQQRDQALNQLAQAQARIAMLMEEKNEDLDPIVPTVANGDAGENTQHTNLP